MRGLRAGIGLKSLAMTLAFNKQESVLVLGFMSIAYRLFSSRVITWLVGLLAVYFICLYSTSLQAAPKAEQIDYWNDHEAGSVMVVNHSPWQVIIDSYLDSEHESGVFRFDYEAVSSTDKGKLDSYLDYLQSIDPRQLNRNEAMAYWINAFNASLVRLIIGGVQNSNIDSVRDLRAGAFTAGPWRRKVLDIAGQRLSFDDIEHGILRPIYADPRVHFAMSAACMSCPNLQPQVFLGTQIEDQLAQAQADYLNHERTVKLENGRLTISRIFDWYSSDFGESDDRVRSYILENIDSELAETLGAVESGGIKYQFDWKLNLPE